MKNGSIVDVLIENIKTDQDALAEIEKQLSDIRENKRDITRRLKDYRKDISVLVKYTSEEQRKKLESLGFDLSDSERGLNSVASKAMEIVMKAKDNKITNGELYEAYKKSFKNEADALDYTHFNIKCRTLFNTQRLLRTEGKDPKSSRDDIISLNGKAVEDKPKAKQS
jgi:predicted  nucleic acid-binding Zn-ribbon protein